MDALIMEDGKATKETTAAIEGVQSANVLPTTGKIDDRLLADLAEVVASGK